MQGMTLDRVCRAIVQAAAHTRPRYVHLVWWCVAFVASAASESGSTAPGRGGLMASLYLATVVLQSAMAIGSAVAFRRYLSRVEFRLVSSATIVVTIGLSLMAVKILLVPGKALLPVPGGIAVFQSAGIAVVLSALAASVLAGRALRRLRSVTGEAQLTDFGIRMFFRAYLSLGAMLLNPMLKRALPIERR